MYACIYLFKKQAQQGRTFFQREMRSSGTYSPIRAASSDALPWLRAGARPVASAEKSLLDLAAFLVLALSLPASQTSSFCKDRSHTGFPPTPASPFYVITSLTALFPNSQIPRCWALGLSHRDFLRGSPILSQNLTMTLSCSLLLCVFSRAGPSLTENGFLRHNTCSPALSRGGAQSLTKPATQGLDLQCL